MSAIVCNFTSRHGVILNRHERRSENLIARNMPSGVMASWRHATRSGCWYRAFLRKARQHQKCVDAAAACCTLHIYTFFARAVRRVRIVSVLNHYRLSTQVFWDMTLGRCFCVSWRFEGRQCLRLRKDPLESAKTQMARIVKRTAVDPINSPIIIC